MYRIGAVIACILLGGALVALRLAAGPKAAEPEIPAVAPTAVVINEVFYNAPDDLDDLQFIELHNTGDAPADLGGCKLTRGIAYTFPAGTRVEPNGYLVVCKSVKEFQKHYGFRAIGPFEESLRHDGQLIDLLDPSDKVIDRVRYGSRAPWPAAADGYGSSLERICPTAPAGEPENWAPSPLPAGPPKPGGTPGKKNAAYAPHVPPFVARVAVTPADAAPGQEVKVEATVRPAEGVGEVELRYRVAGTGYEGEERAVRMTKTDAGRYAAALPGQKAGQIVRFRVRAADARGGARTHPHENDLRPALSLYVHDPFPSAKIPLGMVVTVGAGARAPARGFPFGNPAPAAEPARGGSAFVYVDARTGRPQLFDYVNVTPRKGGHKVRFHKDRPLRGMTTINLIYEYMDRFVLAEPLAYEVHRKAGVASPRTDFVRTWHDGRPAGYQLLVEQPNRAFLRHNKMQADGNLYKLIWYGPGLVGQHEKKTNTRTGHDDLVDLVGRLNATRGEEQWAVIKKEFDVEQVINYFAVNMLLSHWDGFFNNYLTYHDINGSGKWTMHPWDQDKTWGFHDGLGPEQIFFDMPVTFGMAGDVPPGWPKGRPAPAFFGGGPIWWRQPGHFSGPLLANASFRRAFLARTRELLDKVYTEEVFFPIIDGVGKRLEEEVKVRARLTGGNPEQAPEQLRRNLDLLKEHLTKRRKFLLAQDEIKTAGKFDRAELK